MGSFGRITIPDSIPVAVRVGESGSVPGAIASQPVAPGVQTFNAYSRINPANRPSTPYSNIQPSISSAGSGVVNTGGISLADRLAGRSPLTSATPQVSPVTPPEIGTTGYTPLSSRLTAAPPAAASPPVEIPSLSPAINPQNFARPIANAVRSITRGLAPVVATAGRVASVASRALPYLAAGLDVVSGLQSGESVGEALTEAGAALAGTLYGASQGAAIGATIGSVAGPVGTGIGGLVGGAIGATLGWNFGGAVGDRLYDWLFPNHARSNDALTAPQPLPTIPPFYGGQSEGVLYNVTTQSRQTNEYGYEGGGTTVKQVQGRILGAKYENGNYYVQSSTQGDVFVEYLNPYYYYNGQPKEYQVSFSVVSVVRADGQPDTGGNPPPAPGTVRQEGQRAPAIAPAPQIAPQINPQRPIPNNPNPAGQARSIPAPTPAIVPSAATPSSPLHPKNLSPGKAINPFKSVPDSAPNPVAPAGQAELQPTVTAATAPSSIRRPVTPTTTAGQLQPGETAQDYISRLHNEQLQRFRDGANLGFTNPFENLSNNILEQNPATATATPALNPLIPALGVAGLVGAGAVIARRTIPSGLQTANPTQTGNPSAPVTARPTRTQTQTTPQTPEFPGTGSGGQTNFCSYDSLGIKGEVVSANTKLDTLNTTANAINLFLTNEVNSKLGPAIPGGISGALNTIGSTVNTIQNFSKKTWDFLQIDRILSVLTYITVLHNAYQLSSALTQTLFSALSNVLDATGLDEFLGLVDSDDEQVNVGEIVGKATDNFFKTIFGVQTVDGIKATWKKYNRIYQAATNMLYSIQSMVYSMVEIMETISDYTGRIGNALRESGTVLQNAFNWMNPNANYQDGKWFRYLNNIQEVVEVVDEIASEIVSIQDTASQFYEQTTEFNKAVEDAEKKVSDDKTKSKTDSTRPLMNISPQDEHKAEGI